LGVVQEGVYRAMASGSGSDFDVFISYAKVDNKAVLPVKNGWVSVFIENLDHYLAKRIGRREGFQNWYDDEQLKGNSGIREHIPAQVKRSKLFLAILSPGYVASEFCQLELKSFIETHRGSLEDRLFVIEHEPLADHQEVPEPFRDIRKYRFYKLDEHKKPRTFAMPEPRTDEREYYQRIEDLARDIAAKLAAEKPVKPTGPSVFLADVTDDLEPRRVEIRRYLDQAGLSILPDSTYRLDRTEFERAMTADLAKSAVFVQLLGDMAGKRPPDIPDGYNWLQHEIAKGAKLPILQWRHPDLDVSKVEPALQKRLLDLETVKAMPFEDFKRSIVDLYQKVTAPPPPPPPPPPAHVKDATNPSVIFINADTVDRENADAIRDSIGGRFGWSLPLSLTDAEARPEELQRDMEENLINSEGMLIVYGAARPAWVTSQIQQYRKFAPRRNSHLRLLAVVKAPPPGQKAPISIGLPGLLTIEIDRVAEVANNVLS
jgi:hypothetical protein